MRLICYGVRKFIGLISEIGCFLSRMNHKNTRWPVQVHLKMSNFHKNKIKIGSVESLRLMTKQAAGSFKHIFLKQKLISKIFKHANLKLQHLLLNNFE